jgi:Flp pilus assembly protein TadB
MDLPQTKTKHTTQKAKMTSKTDPPQTKTKRTTQKTKMISNTDPQQTKTKYTTQKTKMTSNTDNHPGVRVVVIFVFLCCVFCFCLWGVCVAYYFSFLCCVFCFSLWGSVLLVILVFCVVCFVFVCGGLCCFLPQTKTKHTTQKPKMISNTGPQKQKQNTQHRKLK